MSRRVLGPSFAAFALAASFGAGCASPASQEVVGVDHSADTGESGYCRTTTCQVPSDYPTASGMCEPPGWSDSAQCRTKNASNAPLFWRSSCVGYDLNERASRHVDYDQFAAATSRAFDSWISATCPSNGASSSRPSVDVRDLGAVSCAAHAYDGSGPNQNVIVFHDDAWPYEAADRAATGSAKSLVIALTRVTFDPASGEIYDADVELNSADYTIVPIDDAATAPADAYDLQTILTHEIGHFFGLAHAPSPNAVMFASGDSNGSTEKRALSAEDVRGICAIYPPDGTRAVSSLVDSSGRVAAGACDPTPRHGFTRSCSP